MNARKFLRSLLPLPLDLVGVFAVLSFGLCYSLYRGLRSRLYRNTSKGPHRWMTVTSGAYAQSKSRNLERIYDLHLLGGTVERHLFIYSFADRSESWSLSPQIAVFDFRSRGADRFRPFGLVFTARLLQSFRFLQFLCRLIEREDINVLQSNDPTLQGLHALVAARLTRVPFFVRVNCDYDFYRRERGRLAFPVFRWEAIERFIERFVYRRADRVVGLYEHYTNQASRAGASIERCTTIPNFTDPRYFEDSNYPLPSDIPTALRDRPWMLYLGRLAWDKYTLDLIDVLEEVSQTIPETSLVMVGDGDERDAIFAKAQQKGLSKQLWITGYRNVPDVISLARSARLVVASHGGFSLLELGALGRPVVAYDHDWHREIIRNSDTGILVPFRDTSAMARGAIELLLNPNHALALGQNLQRLVRNKYSNAIVTRQFQDLLDQLRGRTSP